MQKSAYKKWWQKSGDKKVIMKKNILEPHIIAHACAPMHSNKFTSLTNKIPRKENNSDNIILLIVLSRTRREW